MLKNLKTRSVGQVNIEQDQIGLRVAFQPKHGCFHAVEALHYFCFRLHFGKQFFQAARSGVFVFNDQNFHSKNV